MHLGWFRWLDFIYTCGYICRNGLVPKSLEYGIQTHDVLVFHVPGCWTGLLEQGKHGSGGTLSVFQVLKISWFDKLKNTHGCTLFLVLLDFVLFWYLSHRHGKCTQIKKCQIVCNLGHNYIWVLTAIKYFLVPVVIVWLKKHHVCESFSCCILSLTLCLPVSLY